MEDDTNLADDDCANNFFWFQRSTEPIARSSEGLCPPDTFRPSLADPDGRMCPYTAHIRKANPRDDVEVAVRRTHRMLRRGIPFGEPSRSTPNAPEDDDVERGLLFVAYMTNIVRQFDFISDEWINSNDFPVNGAGIDAILGQPNWVALTGGGNYFSPSVSALKEVLSK